jgi:LuxR family transcriptional regulator, maltose regulon positive regulatory protein
VFSKKAQKKPLEVLKAIIAGGGSNVSDTYLTDVLWPDAEGDLSMQALATNLHRLRKLLGRHEAVQLVNGVLSLDKNLCWVDARAFEYLLHRANALWEGATTAEELEEACALTSSAIELYRGEFLPDELWIPDVLPMREHLHGRYIHALSRLGVHLVGEGRYDKARQAIECGLEIDTCAEELGRLLILCLHHQGLKAEALSAYEHLKNTLHEELGTTPSAETEALVKSIKMGRTPQL